MFDPVTFILGMAGSVLGGVITDLINGKSETTLKSEIKKEVSAQLINFLTQSGYQDLQALRREGENLRAIKQKILDEIEIIAGRNPTLLISPEGIQLRKPIKKPIFTDNDTFIKKELISRLNDLDAIVAHRRSELRLTMNSCHAKPKQVSTGEPLVAKKASIVWRSTNRPDEQVSRWKMELMEMEDRVRKRRSRKDMSDE